jgi:hypothetical protein
MAFAAGRFGLIVSYMDNGANVVTREYIMDETIADYADAVTAAGAILTDIIAFTDAALPQYRVFQSFEEQALVIPASGIQVENTASMTMLLVAAGSKKGNVNMPAPKAGVFVSASGPQANDVNTTAAVVTNLVDNFIAAGKFTISDGEKVSRILDGKRVHKKSSKG